MKPAARGLFCPLLCPPQKKIAKKMRKIFVCSKNISTFVVLTNMTRCYGTESRCIFYAHIASIGGVSPRGISVIDLPHLVKVVSSG